MSCDFPMFIVDMVHIIFSAVVVIQFVALYTYVLQANC